MDGGIWGLLGLIRQHRGAVEYDFRHRFGLGLSAIGSGMSLWEAGRLALILRRDPSSAIAAALEGWDFPVSREALALYDLYDLEHVKAGPKRRPKPHPGRPFGNGPKREHRGNVGGRSQAQVRRILARYGH